MRRLVDLVSHRSGTVVALMNDAKVTLPQVLLISRVERFGAASLAELSEGFVGSVPALSQMVDRLVRDGWLDRTEDPLDRRRKAIRVTPRAVDLLRRLEAARSADYELGLEPLSADVRARLAAALERAALEIRSAHERSTDGG